MKVAIHSGNHDYSNRWISFCEEKKISHAVVNCFDSDIVNQLMDFNILLWHWRWINPGSQLAAKQIILALQNTNLCVYPDVNTCWHYDDKIGQKYLLEAIGAPTIPTHIFYDKSQALKFVAHTEFPKVFKLRCGSASANVRLIKTRKEAEKICKIAFSSGFKPMGSFLGDAKVKLKHIENASAFFQKLSRLPNSIKMFLNSNHLIPKQRGYVLFQDFLPKNNTDTRITVVGNKAFAAIRYVRKNDFRASGSGVREYTHEKVDIRCVEMAFQVAKRLKAQSLAFDFLIGLNNEPKICEISYCLPNFAISESEGYWDTDLHWHPGTYYIEDLIIEKMIEEFNFKMSNRNKGPLE
jgi:glutathione synthase/RimK-type ligase-like ATP-grasp enzyme